MQPLPAAHMEEPRWHEATPLWRRFWRTHFFDYTGSATLVWAATVLAGIVSLGWALGSAVLASTGTQIGIAAAMMLAAASSVLSVRVPRTTTTFTLTDAVSFAALGFFGPAAAVLAAFVEGVIVSCRNSKRLTSRLMAPSISTLGMAFAAGLFLLLRHWLTPLLGESGAVVAAICIAAPCNLLSTVFLTLTIVSLKRGEALSPLSWLKQTDWMLAASLVTALAGGSMAVLALLIGLEVLAIAGIVAIALAALLRHTVQRQEEQHQQQAAKVAAAEREAALSHQRFVAAFQHAAIGMAIVRPDGRIAEVNDALCRMMQRGRERMTGMEFPAALLPAAEADSRQRRRGDILPYTGTDSYSAEVMTDNDAGDRLWLSVHCSPFQDPGHAGRGHLYQVLDMTARREAEAKLEHIAFHDSLTELPNRPRFIERVQCILQEHQHGVRDGFAVLFVDLDRFKDVNDTLGHLTGNRLLREVAHRLVTCVRPSDLVARMGGDEFAIVLTPLADASVAVTLAERLQAALAAPVTVGDTEIVPGASIGVAIGHLRHALVDEVLRDADLAMYEAKAQGRGRYVVFDDRLNEKVASRLTLEADLRRAIAEDQLSLAYQPIFDLSTRRIKSLEALVRWNHPRAGSISPDLFVRLAEETGQIGALTDWVLERALAQLAGWHQQLPRDRLPTLHVNISGSDLGRSTMAANVQGMLARHGLAPRLLTLEITETTLMGRLTDALQCMRQLREIGVRFSIDDFGTGYSSLAYLGTLPIDSLKIDRSFVQGMQQAPHNAEIVRAVLNLGTTLGRTVIAEGIETEAQLQALRDMGVPLGQGYVVSRPLAPEAVLNALRGGNPERAREPLAVAA